MTPSVSAIEQPSSPCVQKGSPHFEEQVMNARLEDYVLVHSITRLHDMGFTLVPTPRIVPVSGACENVDTLFEVHVEGRQDWFSYQGEPRRSYLAQTGQLYLEAMVPSLGKVFCVGPSFRAEEKVDARHLTEFMMIEIEFPGNFDELLSTIETFIYGIAQDILLLDEKNQKALGITPENVNRLSKTKKVFPKINYDDAIKILGLSWGDDIHSDQEKELLKYFDNHPVFITRYPDPMVDHGKNIEVEKFFNMLPDKEHPGRVLSSDLILPYGGEAVGAAARVDHYDIFKERLVHSRMFQRLQVRGEDLSGFTWYLETIKKYGSIPHVGCGFGTSRIYQWLRGEMDIRKTVAFPSNKETLM
jgi:asparaginyl-tRNA synthetase